MDEELKLFPARQDGKSGYINSKGKVVIDFVFDFHGSREFTEGLASVMVNDKAGFIDINGNFVIEPKFELAMPFSEGLAYVKYGNSFGFIDKFGQFVIEPKYYSCDSFNDGFALVKDSVFSSGFFIDKSGKTKLQGRDFLISEYREGLVNCPDENGNWGFIDIDGHVVVDFEYKLTRPFYESKSAVTPKMDLYEKPNRDDRFGFINKQNEPIIDPVFQGADVRFSEGRCVVWDDGYGCIDEKGNLIIPYEFELIKHFKEGLAVFKPKGRHEKYGFIDKRGVVIIEPNYAYVEDFSNGLSEVIVGTEYDNFKYGYINKSGEEIWEPRR